MTVIFHSTFDDAGEWIPRLRELLPGIDICECSAVTDASEVQVGVFWDQPPEGLAAYTSLGTILSLGAGINQLNLATIPSRVQIARLVDPSLTEMMTEYCLLGVLRFYRNFHVYERARHWNPCRAVRREEFAVGVMGLGVLGGAVAARISINGFPVRGWSARQKNISGVECYAGSNGLLSFVEGLRCLICLLPLTKDTQGILNAALFVRLEKGAVLINAGRGGHLVQADLLAALDSGGLAGAVLDVFSEEPLPTEHAFWRHGRILVTPHVATIADPKSGAPIIAANITRALRGEKLLNIVDRSRGY